MYHTIIGMPHSGKTTFLAALWHLLNAGEVQTDLELVSLVGGEYTHLNTIAESWRKCERVSRTSTANETTVAICLARRGTDQSAVVEFPDLSGESFDNQVMTRSCTPDYVQGFERTGGVLLFVTADRGEDALTIDDLADVLEGDPAADEPGETQEWDVSMLPTQVRLVELLQFLECPPFRRAQRRLAVIVSAWDLRRGKDETPERWLSTYIPLLWQFLASNPDSFVTRIFGVSAQGGIYVDGAREDLLERIPSKRIVCIGEDVTPHDLTSPIAWLMRDE